MKRLYTCAALILYSSVALSSQTIRFEVLTVENGLPDGTVICMLQDRQGFLWLGTSKGLARYDGYSLRIFQERGNDSLSLSGAIVYALCEDKQGNIWVATVGGGLNKFNPRTEKFTHYRHDSKDPHSLSHNDVFSIYQDRIDRLWVGTRQGLDLFVSSEEKFRHIHPSEEEHTQHNTNQVTAITEDPFLHGILWIGTWGDGVFKLNTANNAVEHFRSDPANPKSLRHNQVRFIYHARATTDYLWVGTEGGGLHKFNFKEGTFFSFQHDPNDPRSIGNNSARCMIEDRSGNLWVGTSGGGLSLFNPLNGKFENYPHDPKDTRTLCNNNVLALLEDNNGVCWVGTRDGLCRFVNLGEQFTVYQNDPHNSNSLSNDFLWSIVEDKAGIIWIASGKGLNRYDPKTEKFTSFQHDPDNPSSLRNDYVRTIYEDRRGTLWVGNLRGILHMFDRTSGRSKSIEIPVGQDKGAEIEIKALLEMSDGTFWVGTSQGLFTFDRDNWKLRPLDIGPIGMDSSSSSHITALYEDRPNRVWIGTWGQGLVRYDKPNGTTKVFKHDPADEHSLSHDIVSHICRDKSGILWVSTFGGGFNKFDDNNETFTPLTKTDGLPDNDVYGFVEDASHNLWIGTNEGLCKFNPNSKLLRIFTIRHGLPSSGFNSRSFCKSRTGKVYMGSTNGMFSFSPDKIEDNKQIPRIFITKVRVFEEELTTDTALSYMNRFDLQHTQNFLSFEFAALDYKDPLENSYAYMLQGLDKKWIYSGKRRYAAYTDLAPGNYTFRVKGSNNDGLWNEEGTWIAVIITPPFWATWWFRVLFVVSMFGSIGGTIRYIEITKLRRTIERLEQEHALERERSRISQDMHDEVGASLTEIAILSELAKKSLHRPKEAGTHVQQISERVAEVIDNIGEIIWAINPKNDLLDNALAHIRHRTVQYLKMTPMKCDVIFPEHAPSLQLSAETRRNLFLVVKEAIHNIVKHSNATKVIVKVEIVDERVNIMIEDNGVGFSPSTILGSGNGLHNMRRRIEGIGGLFTMESGKAKGTRIAFSVEPASHGQRSLPNST